jgi:hypothetical protein
LILTILYKQMNMAKGCSNTNDHDTNEHGPKDERERVRVWMTNGVHTRVRGVVERTQTTGIRKVSPPCHVHPLMMHVNRAMAGKSHKQQ